MSRYRSLPPSVLSIAILLSMIIVGGSLVRGGGDEPKANLSGTKTAEFPWIESPRVGDESKTTDPVALLLRRVEALENRVAALESERQSPIASSLIGQPATPENWRSFEFNGRTIYMVPTASPLSGTLDYNAESEVMAPAPGFLFPGNGFRDQTLLKYERLPQSRK